ncbi:neuropilin and tolloid-like protein 1 isoform X3 [Ptychodera flava]|uniref:neuropilin and tolloid-like protein 1 isoform X3 n=1 Tax=Ptychodera flava TaxID=63121 RepID=UPI003969F55B
MRDNFSSKNTILKLEHGRKIMKLRSGNLTLSSALLILLFAASVGQETSGDDQAPSVPIPNRATPSCGGVFEGHSGVVVYSPNHPNKYPKEVDCVYVIKAKRNEIIRLTFGPTYMIESSRECRFDYLEVRDGRWGYSPFIGRYCGDQQPVNIVSTGRYLWMRFVTDDTVEEAGFAARYEFIKIKPEDPNEKGVGLNKSHNMDECIFEIEGTVGEIDSRSIFPKTSAGLDCTWQITAPLNHKILVVFEKFNLQWLNICENNKVSLYDGVSSETCQLQHYCSGTAPDVFTSSNRLFLRFETGERSSRSQFLAYYTAFTDLPCNSTHFRCGQDMCINRSLVCNERHNCYHFAWDEESCQRTACDSDPCMNGATCLPNGTTHYVCECLFGFRGLNCDKRAEEKPRKPLMDAYAGALFGAFAGLTVIVIAVVVIVSCRHSLQQNKRRASMIEYRRRSVAAMSTGRGSDTVHRLSLPGDLNAAHLHRHGSIRSQYTDPGEYHELDTISSKYGQHARTSNDGRRSSSPTRRDSNSRLYPQYPQQQTTLQVPISITPDRTGNNKPENQCLPEDSLLSPIPTFTYSDSFQNVQQVDLHPYPRKSSFDQYSVQYNEPQQEPRKLDTTL